MAIGTNYADVELDSGFLDAINTLESQTKERTMRIKKSTPRVETTPKPSPNKPALKVEEGSKGAGKTDETTPTVKKEKRTTTPVQEFKPKVKARATYHSMARMAFTATKVTEKEALILGAVEKLNKDKIEATALAISQLTELNENQIFGAISVLLAKGIVTTERVKLDKVRRVVHIEIGDWLKLVGETRADKE